MNNIDERIVNMKFNNGQFLNGVAATINALANLKKGLNVDAPKKGIDALGASMSKLPPPQLAAGIQGISSRFIALSTIGITALTNITNAAITAGTQLIKSLTVDPIKAGLAEYETNLNSIQTILANTGLEGEKGLNKVEKALDELNQYSDQTIYNFSEMAKNIGTFTAAGVDLDTSSQAIKGIANLAAVSGSNAQQASTAMYQLSQSLASGKVTLEDWNSVVNAGMGGKVFQEALKETARVHGVAVDSIIKEQGSFRNSLQEGWITSEVLTETLGKFTEDVSKSQLKAMGYNEEQIRGIVKMQQTATDAATKVKTMSQLINTLQETAQSGWAKTWQTAFGDFNEAKTLFTNVNNVLGEMLGASADARNSMLADWKKLGGRKALIEGIGNVFNGLREVLAPIQNAFRDIFPPTTGKQLFALTQGFLEFSKTIKIGAVDAKNLRSTFAGLFAIFSIAGSLIKGLLTVVGSLFGAFGDGTSGLLNFTGGIGEFLVSLDEAIKGSKGFTEFFENLGNTLAVPIQLLFALGEAIRAALGGEVVSGGTSAIDGALERIGSRLEPFQAMADAVANAWGRMGGVLQSVWDFMAPFASAVGDLFGSIGEAISKSVSDGDFSTILDTINTGLLGALVLAIRKFLSDGSIFSFGGGDSGGFLDGIKETFGGLTDTLSAMQASLKAGTLMKIASAVALLTASVIGLSLIDSAALGKALGALTVMFLQLAGAMVLFDAATSAGSVLKLAPMAAGLILLSTAILILTGAVKVLSTMSWEDLAKGLSGLVVLLAAVAGAVKLMSGSGAGLISAGVGMVAMSVGIKVLASAVGDLAGLSWDEMIRGLAGLAGSLGIIAGAMKLMPGAIPGALAMLIVAPALIVLAGALKLMSSMSWEEFAKSMAALAGGLLIIAGALYLMTAALPGAAAMLVVAPALIVLAYALKIMATMSWEDFGKAMAILASSLGILAVGLTLMIVALPGAAALLVAAAALAVLAPILMLFGAMSWEEIGKGLTMLAATLGIIGLAGAVLTPVIPTLLGLGAAIALIGIGTLAAGAGLLAFSAGLTALSIAGAAGAAALVAIVSGLIGLIPMAMNAVAEGIVLMANVISGAGPEFITAMTTLMTSLLVSINNVAPQVINTIWRLIVMLANKVASGYPKLVSAGLRLITGVLNGIASNVNGIVTAATSIIVNFINALASNLPRITEAGANLVITLVESLAGSINANAGRMRAAGQELAFAIVDGMTGGLLSGASSVISAAADMAGNALQKAKDVLGIASPSKEFTKIGRFAAWGFANGLTGDRTEIKAAMKAMNDVLLEAIRNTNDDVKKAEDQLKKLTSARTKDVKAIKKAQEALNKARKENYQARNARDVLVNHFKNEEAALLRLSKAYDGVTNKLDKAMQGLADARKLRDDYNRSIRDQYGDLGQIEGTTLKGFTTSLKAQIAETQEFARLLAQLRKNGLSDVMYEELLRKGPDALPLLRSISQGGKAGVNELNKLSGQLASTSNALGTTASRELYQAGVDAAAGLVRGLANQQKNIEKQMDKIAAAMVKSIKKRLGIRSPSRAFAEVGVWSVEGLIGGMDTMASKVSKSADKIGDAALSTLENSLHKVGDFLQADMDMAPTIRPVLDLSAVRAGAKTIPGLMRPMPIRIDPVNSRRIGLPGEGRFKPMPYYPEDSLAKPVQQVTTVNMTQNNTSPKALSPVEIYRNTKNLVSTVKGGLPK